MTGPLAPAAFLAHLIRHALTDIKGWPNTDATRAEVARRVGTFAPAFSAAASLSRQASVMAMASVPIAEDYGAIARALREKNRPEPPQIALWDEANLICVISADAIDDYAKMATEGNARLEEGDPPGDWLALWAQQAPNLKIPPNLSHAHIRRA